MTNVLIVEDEPRARAYLAKGLTQAGFTVDTAPGGEAGAEWAEQQSSLASEHRSKAPASSAMPAPRPEGFTAGRQDDQDHEAPVNLSSSTTA